MKERMKTKPFLKRKERIYLQLMDEKRGTRFGLIPPSDMKDWVIATIYILQSCLLYSGSLQFVHPNVLSASKDGYKLYSELRNRKKLEKIKEFIENNGNLHAL